MGGNAPNVSFSAYSLSKLDGGLCWPLQMTVAFLAIGHPLSNAEYVTLAD